MSKSTPKTRKRKFESEANLCEHFVDHAKSEGWIVYPETAGFDMLLVATEETINARRYSHVGLQVGDQLGVEAKMSANVTVLAQSLPYRNGPGNGPDFHVVLIPSCNHDFVKVAARLGILVAMAYYRGTYSDRVTIEWPTFGLFARTLYENQCWTPDVPVETAAGVPSPRSISKWKIDAVRFCLLAEKKEFVLSQDFADAGLSGSTFVNRKWFVPIGKIGRLTKYGINPASTTIPHMKYPEISRAVREMLATDAATEAAKYLSRKRVRSLSHA